MPHQLQLESHLISIPVTIQNTCFSGRKKRFKEGFA